ncbi:hypothetical protein LENED_012799 [Lentinula edodes]|uniref:Uncharacterized protein n=1 Tax=Lentinula edodes TaxID=5353 RepID=A0A1Q3ETG4_LENED|nr:hypothetical protein LENED_012799 [Lentinula edodes]
MFESNNNVCSSLCCPTAALLRSSEFGRPSARRCWSQWGRGGNGQSWIPELGSEGNIARKQLSCQETEGELRREVPHSDLPATCSLRIDDPDNYGSISSTSPLLLEVQHYLLQCRGEFVRVYKEKKSLMRHLRFICSSSNFFFPAVVENLNSMPFYYIFF